MNKKNYNSDNSDSETTEYMTESENIKKIEKYSESDNDEPKVIKIDKLKKKLNLKIKM